MRWMWWRWLDAHLAAVSVETHLSMGGRLRVRDVLTLAWAVPSAWWWGGLCAAVMEGDDDEE